MTTIHDTIARIRTLMERATPAPWTFREYVSDSTVVGTIGEMFLVVPSRTPTGDDADDSSLIVESVNAMPAILAHIERLEAVANAARVRIRQYDAIDETISICERARQWNDLRDALTNLDGADK
jgi:hypothetical protein